MTLRIATAATFAQDRVAAHAQLLESVDVDLVLLTYLDEALLPHLVVERAGDAGRGYVPEVLAAVRAFAPRLFLEPGLRILTDAGGLNPRSCAEAVARVLADAGQGEVPVAIVRGDDLLDALEELHSSGAPLEHAHTGAPFAELERPILAAHAELDGRGVHQAIEEGARIVITGTVAATSLVAGAAVGGLGWAWDDWERLAAAATAGMLLREGTRLTAGDADGNADLRMHPSPPIVELGAEGQAALSQVPRGDGKVTQATVAAALARGARDPARFLTPDVEVDLAGVQVAERPERQDVLVWGAAGRPAPEFSNVTLWYQDGFTASADLWFSGHPCLADAKRLAETVTARLQSSGARIEQVRTQFPGFPHAEDLPPDAPAVLLRLTATDRRRDMVEQFVAELLAAARNHENCIGPLGSGLPTVEPLIRQWPTVVPRELIQPSVDVRPADQW